MLIKKFQKKKTPSHTQSRTFHEKLLPKPLGRKVIENKVGRVIQIDQKHQSPHHISILHPFIIHPEIPKQLKDRIGKSEHNKRNRNGQQYNSYLFLLAVIVVERHFAHAQRQRRVFLFERVGIVRFEA